MTRLSVVVPAYNEAEVLPSTLPALRAALGGHRGGLEIVVSDDGSSDGTPEAAARAGADLVVGDGVHRGKGAAVRAGMLAASGDLVVFTDADLAYPPGQIIRLVDALESGADVVAGSRHHVDTVTLVRRRRLREVAGRVFNAATRVLVLHERRRDTQCGLKGFTAHAARAVFGRARVDGFAFDVEVFVIAAELGLEVREVPVELSNSARSTVRVGRDAVGMVRDLLAVRARAERGEYRAEGHARTPM
ncbi:MAG TPA: glycosyltransferase [Acidimicrobiales bacterium]|nr:glycosyltransferase [Acidimicrobiales bacterium]